MNSSALLIDNFHDGITWLQLSEFSMLDIVWNSGLKWMQLKSMDLEP